MDLDMRMDFTYNINLWQSSWLKLTLYKEKNKNYN